MKVVLTGGAGFIGSNLARLWRRQHPEDELVVFDLLTYAGRRESIRDLERAGLGFVQGDVADYSAVAPVVAGSDLVVHLAAETHNDRAIVDPTPFLRTNVVGTGVLLEACRRHDVGRFHHVSTDEVFGSLSLDDPHRFTEASPYRPRGPYSASKAGSDHLVRAWSETYGLPTTISNCGNNFGPYQFPEKLIPRAIVRLIRGLRVPLFGDGKHVRDWIYVEDHCEALDVIAHRGKLGTTYLVSGENELSNRQILDRLLPSFGRGPEAIEVVADRPGHDRRYALDPGRLKSELGWTPKRSFPEALAETVSWYRGHPEWWEPLSEVAEASGPAAARGAA
ncbi:MAG: dTDP-glucose 4,6-dehydratase [Thermoplasmata archaeon]|nr:dTDP-glucose 4,6-dehydratase [Thermoplasmata archaeon]